jgi:hypothetical protein
MIKYVKNHKEVCYICDLCGSENKTDAYNVRRNFAINNMHKCKTCALKANAFKRIITETKICPICKKPFTQSGKKRKSDQIFCSISCGGRNKINPNKPLFTNGWNHINSYIAGMIFSDGCLSSVNRETGTWRITIITKDKTFADDLHFIIGATGKIGYQRSALDTDVYRITINNQKDIAFLIKNQLTERKSNNMIFPNINAKYFGSFLRGYFDGDGSVSVTKGIHRGYFRVSFTSGSLIFLEEIKTKLEDDYNIVSKIAKDHRKDTFYLYLNETENIQKLFTLMYKNNKICLWRKYDKFMENNLMELKPRTRMTSGLNYEFGI